MRCNDQQLSAYADGEIQGPMAGEIQGHIEDCVGCRARLASLLMLQNRLTEYMKSPVESVDMRESVMSLLPRQAARRPLSYSWLWAPALVLAIAVGIRVWFTQPAHVEHSATRHLSIVSRVTPRKHPTSVKAAARREPTAPAMVALEGSRRVRPVPSHPEPARATPHVPAPSVPEAPPVSDDRPNTAPMSGPAGPCGPAGPASDADRLASDTAGDGAMYLADAPSDRLPVGPGRALVPPRVGCSDQEGILSAGNVGVIDPYGRTDTSPANSVKADMPASKPFPERGIAVLASGIGSYYTPEGLAEFVRRGQFSLVVVDWAWITYHWDRTDFRAVNRFLDLMAAGKVSVAAMYRPRFLSDPTVATQVAQDGTRTVDHAEICYSDASARRWGISWGDRILAKCPHFREIIIYNPLNHCHCPLCASGNAPVLTFLSEARSSWRVKHPGVKLGLVYVPAPDFWKSCLKVVDVAHPFLSVRESVDLAQDVADIRAVRSVVGPKMGSCLAKVTWEEGARVSAEKLTTFAGLVRESNTPYFLWTFDTMFDSSLYDPKTVAQVLGMNAPAVCDTLGRIHRPAPEDQHTESGP